MFVTNIKTEFYDVISGNKVLLLVGCDVDAICACKILQHLFHCDNVLYTLIPVYGKLSLLEAYTKHKDQAKYVVMINCGSTIDIIEILEPLEDVVFFIVDSHRPVNVYNAYSGSQIRLLMKVDDCEGIPEYQEIFKDDDDNTEDEDDEAGGQEAVLIKRRERRLWEENRNRIMFDYSQISYYGQPSSILIFQLAWQMSRDSNDLLWWTIIGLTEQFVFNKSEQEKYIGNAGLIEGHMSHLNRIENNSHNAVSCMKISFEKELNLALYRHWSLYESLLYSNYTACKFKLWTFKGTKKMMEFLAEMGVPLTQCKQRFSAMDMEFRNNISSWMENISDKYSLDGIVFGAFVSQLGFKGKFSATDIVLAVHALLESIDKEKTSTDKFLDALYALSRGEMNAIKRGIDLAKARMVATFRQVQVFLDMKQIINAGPFLYAIVPNTTHDARYFSHPECLAILARFTLEAHVNNTKSRKAGSMPLLLFAQDEKDPDRCIVVGIPPLSEKSFKNFFGKAFEQAAEQSKIPFSQDLFCEQFIYINRNDQGKFLNSLFLLLG